MLVDDKNKVEDIADDSTVEDLINSDQIVEETIVVVDEAVTITDQMWLQIANHFAITNVNEKNAQSQVAEFVRIGQKYDTLIRDNANKMAVAAGLGDMKDYIANIPHDNALAALKSNTKIAESKGLLSGTRASVPVDNNKVNAKPQKERASDGASDSTSAEDMVNSSKEELQNSGAYRF